MTRRIPTDIDFLAEYNREERLRRHLTKHGVSLSLSRQLASHYRSNCLNQGGQSWLKKLVDTLLAFSHTIK